MQNGKRVDRVTSRQVTSYRDLVAWQRAMDLIDLIYARMGSWPTTELYGLTAQVRSAAVSIAANIAEGHGRNGRREYVHHLGIARGSLCEVETMLIIGARQNFLTEDELTDLLDHASGVGRILNGLLRSLIPDP